MNDEYAPDKYQTKNKCLVPHCKSIANRRGLCVSHYNFTRYLIQREKVTDKELVKHGKILPKNQIRKTSKTTEWFLEFKTNKTNEPTNTNQNTTQKENNQL